MAEDYTLGFVELERKIIEVYLRIIDEKYGILDKKTRDEVSEGLERIVRRVVENLPKEKKD